MEKKQLLVEEYKLYQDSVQKLESTIWTTSGVIGIGSLGTIIAVLSQFSPGMLLSNAENTETVTPTFLFIVVLIGVVVTTIVWLWWGMAQRWWTIQHITLRRMRHIEKELGLNQKRYIDYRDYNLPGNPWSPSEYNKMLSQLREIRPDFSRDSPLGRCHLAAGGCLSRRYRLGI